MTINVPIIHIMHVDDNPHESFFVTEAFRELNCSYTITSASNGYEAIHLLEASSHDVLRRLPELILLDVNMPRMGGLELLAVLKRHREWRSIPVIILTTSQCPQERASAIALGSNGFEIKPNSFDGYVQLMRRLKSKIPTLRAH